MANSGSNRPNRPVRPRQGGVGRRRRRVVIDQQAARPRPDSRQARDQRDARPKSPPKEVVQPTGPVEVPSGATVKELSAALGITVAQIIKIMMGLGEMVTITQSLSDESIELIATEVGREVTIKHAAEEDVEPEDFDDADEDLAPRPPVVTIMGHVDHGKTTLLDAIRKTAVVETEAGGITQHIGAYQVQHNGREITFLDTPGHEAFTAMRARGAKVTDIAVLVVAADDGVMPQTKESIAHARAAEVPIVVAVNKIDAPNADPNRVRTELAAEGLQPEEWGGTTQFSDVSAKSRPPGRPAREGAPGRRRRAGRPEGKPNAEASGPIIESRLDLGRGPVATMLIHRGTLNVGDAMVAGDALGQGARPTRLPWREGAERRAGDPMEILGFDHPPPGGELGRVVENERQARHLAQLRGQRLRTEQLAQTAKPGLSLERMFTDGAVQDLNVIVKADVAARSRRRSRWSRSRTRRCASSSSTRPSASGRRATSCSPPPRRPSSSASTSA